jgi:hypothetical protein
VSSRQQRLLTISTVALLGLSCSTTPLVARRPPGGTQFHQSCGAACAAPVNASTGEFLAPAATRAGQVLQKVAEALQGLNTLERALSGGALDLTNRCPAARISPAGLFQFGIP